MGAFVIRILISIFLGLVSGGFGYLTREMLREWGVLDPYAAALGGWLKMQVNPSVLWDWAGFSVFGILYVFSLFFIWQWSRRTASERSTKRPLPPTKFIPFVDFRKLASEAGWNVDPCAIAVGDNGFWTFLTHLRQAATDGAVSFKGREFIGDYTRPDTDDKPLILIKPDHFKDFWFDVLNLAQPENYDITTRKNGHTQTPTKGESYREIRINESQAKEWLKDAGNPPSPAVFNVKGNKKAVKHQEQPSAYNLVVKNISGSELRRCLIKVKNWQRDDGSQASFDLRTEEQLSNGRSGRFGLSPDQEKLAPLVWTYRADPNAYLLISENETQFPLSKFKHTFEIEFSSEKGSEVLSLTLDFDDELGWHAVNT